MKYVLFIIGLIIQISSFSQSRISMLRTAAAFYTIYNNTISKPSIKTSSPNYTYDHKYLMSSNTPKLDISTIFKSKEFPAQVYLPKLSMPKEGRPNFQAPNPETNRLLLLQDTVVKNNIQSTRYSSETNSSLSDYNQLINEIYPMETGVETNRTNSNEFHFFEMKKTTYNYFTINRIKSEDSKKDCASGLYNLFSIGAKGVEPIAKPQFGYAKMVLTTKM